MYIVKMFDHVERVQGFLTSMTEFGLRTEAAEFLTKDDAEKALKIFLTKFSSYAGDYICKIKKIN